METAILILLVLLVAGLGYGLMSLSRNLRDLKDAQTNDKGLLMLNQNLQGMSERLDKTTSSLNDRLNDTNRAISENLRRAADAIGEVKKELGTVQERFKGFEEFSDLMHPKMRGNIGEQILADMLAQVFSDAHYDLQYKFKAGQVVDAVVHTKSGIIPIDSKFPLENFKQLNRAKTEDQRKIAQREFSKAVKKHVDDISKKYILADEGTVNFAVMYVPSENVYYHILNDEDNALLEHAKTKNVLMTSPHGFFSFLRVILMGMERTKLQEQAQKIWDILKGVQSESAKFGDSLGVLAGHLTRAQGAMDSVNSGYTKLTGKIEQVQLLDEVKEPAE